MGITAAAGTPLESDKGITLYSTRRTLDQQTRITLSVRGAVTFGPPEVASYISGDYPSAMDLAAQYNVANHQELITVIEERLAHGALGSGVL